MHASKYNHGVDVSVDGRLAQPTESLMSRCLPFACPVCAGCQFGVRWRARLNVALLDSSGKSRLVNPPAAFRRSAKRSPDDDDRTGHISLEASPLNRFRAANAFTSPVGYSRDDPSASRFHPGLCGSASSRSAGKSPMKTRTSGSSRSPAPSSGRNSGNISTIWPVHPHHHHHHDSIDTERRVYVSNRLVMLIVHIRRYSSRRDDSGYLHSLDCRRTSTRHSNPQSCLSMTRAL